MATFSTITTLLVAAVIFSLNEAITPSTFIGAHAAVPYKKSSKPAPARHTKCVASGPKGTYTSCTGPALKRRRPVTKAPQRPVRARAPPAAAHRRRHHVHPPAHPVHDTRPPIGSPPSEVRSGGESLSNTYYANTCPQLESIVLNKVTEWVKVDLTLAASLLRLHFHDCTATGNDASILLTDPKGHSTEMYSPLNKGLRGFEVVDDIKAAVEKECPGVVSCADVLTTIARDVTLAMGGPFWFVPFGRKDTLTSRIEDAVQVPHQEADVNTLLKQFDAMGLSFVDLATLSGAHSVGRAHCFSFTRGGAAGANPAMNATYRSFVMKECKPGPWDAVFNDPVTPYTLDLQYYKNLREGMGLFKSDQDIYGNNDMTRSMVDAFLSQPGMWEAQFAVSMVNLGNVNVLSGSEGEIRRVCSVRNR